MKTGDITKADRADDILTDVRLYIDELETDQLHDSLERWTARMDTVNEELHKLLDIIAELETESKLRMLAKVKKVLLP